MAFPSDLTTILLTSRMDTSYTQNIQPTILSLLVLLSFHSVSEFLSSSLNSALNLLLFTHEQNTPHDTNSRVKHPQFQNNQTQLLNSIQSCILTVDGAAVTVDGDGDGGDLMTLQIQTTNLLVSFNPMYIKIYFFLNYLICLLTKLFRDTVHYFFFILKKNEYHFRF